VKSMIDFVTIFSNVIAGIILSVIIFLFTNSKLGSNIMSGVKAKINASYEEKEKKREYESELETQDGRVKKISSKLYEQPEKYDVNTFFTINSVDLDRFDIFRFMIKDKVDGAYISFDITSEFLKDHTPKEYLEGEGKKIQVYIRRLRGKKQFTIERLGKAVESLPVTEFKQVQKDR